MKQQVIHSISLPHLWSHSCLALKESLSTHPTHSRVLSHLIKVFSFFLFSLSLALFLTFMLALYDQMNWDNLIFWFLIWINQCVRFKDSFVLKRSHDTCHIWMVIFIESEITLIWKFKGTWLNMTKEDSTRHLKQRLHNTTLRKTQIDSTNWRYENWKRLNIIEMTHPLAQVFTWIKSLRHIPSFILACFSPAHFLRLWLGDHPLIYQILNFMLQP